MARSYSNCELLGGKYGLVWVLIVCLMTMSCLWANVGRWVSKACLMTVSCLGANVEPNFA